MALPANRVILGETAHAHEREAIDFAIGEIPNTPPYMVWGLVELLDPSTGRLYEIDLIVLGYSALYLVEIKSGPGVYKGDSVDWYRDVPGERAYFMDCPYRLTNSKAKVLASLLSRKLGKRAPWVQPLVFLSHPETKLGLRADGLTGVLTRATLKAALTKHDFPNRDPGWRADPIPQPVARDIVKALEEIGIRKRKGQLFAGAYELSKDILEDGPGYQDRLAVNRNNPAIRQRARTYLVPQQTSVERRQSLKRAASREAQLLYELREHTGILRFTDYVEDAPLGPTVFFDEFKEGARLDTFLRQEPGLPFASRIGLIAQVGHAIAFCHRKGVIHGGLNPEAVLVRRLPDQTLETRVLNFQLGSAPERVEGTVHVSALSATPWLVYQAPEVRQDPLARNVQSDIFSLGALAYAVLTGQPPATDAAALDDRLTKQGALDPRAADDTIPVGIAEVIRNATDVSWSNRYDDAGEWVGLLLEYATAPETKAETRYTHPLEAQTGDRLSDELTVTGILGQGASARVLRVERSTDGGDFALKVSLSAAHDERIRAEGRALGKFRHPRIVECFGELMVGDRVALRLSLAGTRTLHKELVEKGPVILDYALRWGEDLLGAVEYLEGEEITHRDIKPANIGVGAIAKKGQRLTLFDFSLVLSDPTILDVGTGPYRDPFLRAPARPVWDFGADRYSAAVTLHEMLTGARPSWQGSSPVDPNAKLVLAAERFDPEVRDRLVRFFEKALARELSARFRNAEEMRHAWAACFGSSAATADARAPALEEDEARPQDALTDEQIAKIAPDAPLDALPLSIRARNALDRAGVVRASGLLRLADNRLSAIRGVGALTAREIHDFRVRWEQLAGAVEVSPAPFFPGYRGEDLLLAATAVDGAVAGVLVDAGLRTLATLASAPADHIAALGEKHTFAPAALRTVLDAENRRAEERDRPTTLEGWSAALLPPKKKSSRLVRVLFGLTPPAADQPLLPLGASAADVHRVEGSTAAAVYIAVGKTKKEWAEHPSVEDLVMLVRSILEDTGGMPLADAAAGLLARLAHDRSQGLDDLTRHAAALIRSVGELEREAELRRVVLARVHKGELWAFRSASYVAPLKGLGDAADDLARRTPLASANEARSELAAVVAGTVLAELPVERLIPLAARASDVASCSTRLELYPRGMPAERALELTAAVLTVKAGEGLTVSQLQKRVADRYPDAAPLPFRPELDSLVAAHGLSWSETDGAYLRPGEVTRTAHITSYTSAQRQPSALPAEPRAMNEDAIEARDFDERLMRAVEQRGLRVVLVRSDLAVTATKRLTERLRVPVQRMDRLLIDAMEARARTMGVNLDAMHEADHDGAGGKAWRYLLDLAGVAATDLARTLLPAKQPLVLSHLGLISRYRLQTFVEALAAASTDDACDAIVLVVPSHDVSGQAPLDGVTIPGFLPSHRLRVPRAWVENRHNAAIAS